MLGYLFGIYKTVSKINLIAWSLNKCFGYWFTNTNTGFEPTRQKTKRTLDQPNSNDMSLMPLIIWCIYIRFMLHDIRLALFLFGCHPKWDRIRFLIQFQMSTSSVFSLLFIKIIFAVLRPFVRMPFGWMSFGRSHLAGFHLVERIVLSNAVWPSCDRKNLEAWTNSSC